MNSKTRRTKRRRARAGFSLASLILFMAVVAIFFAGAATVLDTPDNMADQNTAFFCGGGGAIVGLVVGIVVGLSQARRVNGAIIGIVIGSTTGGATGLLVAAPTGMVALLVGSPMLVLFAAVARKFSADPADQE